MAAPSRKTAIFPRPVRRGLILVLAVLPCACEESAPTAAAPPRPNPAAVAAFEFQPDAVLLVTGSSNGVMELCDCPVVPPGGLSRRSGLLTSYRKVFPYTATLDLGDALWVQPEHLRNEFVVRAYRQMGYDAMVLGEQEWAVPPWLCPDVFRADGVDGAGGMALVSTNVAAGDANACPPTVPCVRWDWPAGRVALVSCATQEAFWFTDAARRKQLSFEGLAPVARQIERLRAEGCVVVLAFHGLAGELEEALQTLRPDLVLRGHTGRPDKAPQRVRGVPVIAAGGFETVSAIALDLRPGGIERVAVRVEPATERFPADRRLVQTYRAYGRYERRMKALGGRKKPLEYVSAEQCGQCHQPQYNAWRRSDHAHAMDTLKELSRQNDRSCLLCHTTAFESPRGFRSVAATPELASVSCQACHWFNADEHQVTGFRAPRIDRATCAECHSPFADPTFDFDRRRGRVCPHDPDR